MQPVRDYNRLWATYFVIFLILGAFFVLELFVGVIIENFSRLREMKGHGLMTGKHTQGVVLVHIICPYDMQILIPHFCLSAKDAQRQWAATQMFIAKIRPEILLRRPNKQRFRAICYDFVMPDTNPCFDKFIASVIIANSLSIAMVSFGNSEDMSRVLGMLNLAFSSIFILEAALKLVAMGKGYFRSKWNIFDFVVVCGLCIGFTLQLVISGHNNLTASISSLISLLRMGRLVRLVRLVKSLRVPFNTMLSVLPGMMNIGALLLLLFFVYAVCGMQLYGTIAFQGGLNEQNNFRNVGAAMMLLLRFATGEGWNLFMYELMEDRGAGCRDDNLQYDETSPWCLNENDYPNCKEVNGCAAGNSVFIYFYSFMTIVSLIILNMFVAIVLQAFEASNEGEILQPRDLEHFVRVWQIYDPDATWYINASDVQSFLSRLSPPLGMAGHGKRNKGELYTKDPCLLEISVNKKKQVNIVNVARCLAKRVAIEKQGDDFSALDEHPISISLTKKSSIDETATLGDVYLDSSLVILRSVLRFKNRGQRNLEHPDTNEYHLPP